ncbi:MAG: hypothetical protein ACT6WE_03020, partial [Shinella sp.]
DDHQRLRDDGWCAGDLQDESKVFPVCEGCQKTTCESHQGSENSKSKQFGYSFIEKRLLTA